jgi:hypothetical protein
MGDEEGMVKARAMIRIRGRIGHQAGQRSVSSTSGTTGTTGTFGTAWSETIERDIFTVAYLIENRGASIRDHRFREGLKRE